MTNPYRELCAELVDIITAHANPDDAAAGYVAGVLTRARALQDQPEPPSLKERALTLLKAMQSRSNLLHTVHPNIPNGWVANQVEFNLLYRALLAQPVAEGPTDEEIMELMPQQLRDDLSHAARAVINFENPKAAGAMRIILNRHAVDHARAVLARWGQS